MDVIQQTGGGRNVMRGLCNSTSLPPAPEHLLKVIRCNCKSDCSTLICSCKKHNIECTPACGNRKGSGCTNVPFDNDTDDLESQTNILILIITR